MRITFSAASEETIFRNEAKIHLNREHRLRTLIMPNRVSLPGFFGTAQSLNEFHAGAVIPAYSSKGRKANRQEITDNGSQLGGRLP